MDTGKWLVQNWFNLFSVTGIIGSLWIAIITLRSEAKTRRVANLLVITSNHREVWKEFFHSPQLARILEPSADISKSPPTPAEEFFVSLVVSHISSVYETLKGELLIKQEGLRRDAAWFFSLPIPNAVWTATKLLQNQDFAAFIESSLKSPGI